MKKIKSLSEERLIVEAKVNGKDAYFLIDTGASIGMIDYGQRYDYDLKVGRRYGGTLIGAGGEMRNVKHCDTFVHIEDRVIPQFLLADISEVVKSIKRETGIEILGIISLPQCKLANISLDCNDNEIILE
jgi:hypothetical protein